jgi:uncharacterized protein (DUF1778 family)
MPEAKSARINLRLSPDALETVRAAASVQQQDLTSFILGAAMERARAVLAEDRILRLTPHEVNHLERALDAEPEVGTQLKAFIRRFSADWEPVSGQLPMSTECPLEDRLPDAPEHRSRTHATCGNVVS